MCGKAIYELTVKEDAQGSDYESKIKSLKEKFPDIDPSYFDVLAFIKDMTSDNVHEQSWEKWNSAHLNMFIETIRQILIEIYVLPVQKGEKAKIIEKLRHDAMKDKSELVDSKD